MAFNDIELQKYKMAVESFIESRRPPVSIRDEVDLSFRIENQSVFIFEIRPMFGNKKEKVEIPIAKTTFVKSSHLWKVFWQRADLKWHPYEPKPTVKTLLEFLEVVEEDEYCCFWG